MCVREREREREREKRERERERERERDERERERERERECKEAGVCLYVCDPNYISNITHQSRRVVVRVDVDSGVRVDGDVFVI